MCDVLSPTCPPHTHTNTLSPQTPPSASISTTDDVPMNPTNGTKRSSLALSSSVAHAGGILKHKLAQIRARNHQQQQQKTTDPPYALQRYGSQKPPPSSLKSDTASVIPTDVDVVPPDHLDPLDPVTHNTTHTHTHTHTLATHTHTDTLTHDSHEPTDG